MLLFFTSVWRNMEIKISYNNSDFPLTIHFHINYLILCYKDYCSLHMQYLTSLVVDRFCLYSSMLKPELLSSPQD